ncbi:MAG: ABC transporter permease subunit [Thiolinea sp.]
MQTQWKNLVVAVPYFWLLLFFLVPFFIVMKISLAESIIASPPFSSLISWTEDGALQLSLLFDNYAYLWEDELYYKTYLNSIKVAFICTLICLLIGYPMAYGIVRSTPTTRNILLILVILPFWTSFLLRVYAWMGILADQGTLNNFFIWLGIIDEPIRMLYTPFAVYLGIIYSYLPFMILPLYANIEKLDMSLLEAASDLGAKPLVTFFTVTLPMTMPGVIAGSLLVFIPATGEYVIPDLLGGGNSLMIGKVLYSEFNNNHDWPVASAVAVALLILLVVPMMLYQHMQSKATTQV